MSYISPENLKLTAQIIKNSIDGNAEGIEDIYSKLDVVDDDMTQLGDRVTQLNTKVDNIDVSEDIADWASNNLADVAYSGNYNDLSNTPSLATVAYSGNYNDLSNTPALASVAYSGSYTDLSNTPTIPEQVQSDWGITTTNSYAYIKRKPSVFEGITRQNYIDFDIIGYNSSVNLNTKPELVALLNGSGFSFIVNSFVDHRNRCTISLTSSQYNQLQNISVFCKIDGYNDAIYPIKVNSNTSCVIVSESRLTSSSLRFYKLKHGECGRYATAINLGTATGEAAFAAGTNTVASSKYSVAFGDGTIASHYQAFAAGNNTKATGENSFATGKNTEAFGAGSHAEGKNSAAAGSFSHAEGIGTTTSASAQHVFGRYNIRDNATAITLPGTYVEIVGNGTTDNARSNARTLDWDGNEWLAGKLTMTTLTPTVDGDATSKYYVDNTIPTITATTSFTTGVTIGNVVINGNTTTFFSPEIVVNPLTTTGIPIAEINGVTIYIPDTLISAVGLTF